MTTFKALNINDTLVDILRSQYICEPTPIQTLSIPAIMNGKEIMAEAETGSGKTLAFLLPIIQNCKPEGKIQSLIIAPTRELAIQIYEVATQLAPTLHILNVYGGQDIQTQLKKLKRNVHMIIATPGRLIDHLNRGNINLKSLEYFVLDEVDQLLEMGFRDDLANIAKYCSPTRQTIGFSATISKNVKKLSYLMMSAPEFISCKAEAVPHERIQQHVIYTKPREKFDALDALLNQHNPFLAIVFCRTRRRVDNLEVLMHQAGYNCAKLHGGMPQSKRQRAMKAFRDLKIQYLIATEVAARGLDVTGVTHVIHYDMPETTESYVHRIGRTGRMTETGSSYVLVNEEEREAFQEFVEQLNINIQTSE